jgi:hypothetical protein
MPLASGRWCPAVPPALLQAPESKLTTRPTCIPRPTYRRRPRLLRPLLATRRALWVPACSGGPAAAARAGVPALGPSCAARWAERDPGRAWGSVARATRREETRWESFPFRGARQSQAYYMTTRHTYYRDRRIVCAGCCLRAGGGGRGRRGRGGQSGPPLASPAARQNRCPASCWQGDVGRLEEVG